MTNFILVHGTWATGAPWPTLRSSISNAFQTIGKQARFTELLWDGKNRADDRARAADLLNDQIVQCIAEKPSEDIFVIGFSHGGNAVAYYRKNYTAPSQVKGCIFLSTPFIALRPRFQGIEIYHRALTAILGSFAALYSLLVFDSSDSIWSWWFWIKYFPAMAAIFLLGSAHTALNRTANDSGKIADKCRQWQTANIPEGNYLFLRFAGDEAFFTLSFLQLIAWRAYKLAPPLTMLAINPFAERSLSKYVDMILGVMFPIVFMIFGWYFMTDFTFVLLHEANYNGNWFLYIPAMLVFFFGIASFFGALWLFVIALIVVVSFTSSLYFFGWPLSIDGLYVEASKESLPFGDHELSYFDWSEGPGILRETHSWTYEHTEANKRVSDWVLRSLQTPKV
jgi:hypothetical protein